MRPRIPRHLQATLDVYHLEMSAFQPVHLFPKDGRKLPNVAIETDPWEVFLRKPGSFGVVGRGVAPTLVEALTLALKGRSGRGLLTVMKELGDALDGLTEVVRACQD